MKQFRFTFYDGNTKTFEAETIEAAYDQLRAEAPDPGRKQYAANDVVKAEDLSQESQSSDEKKKVDPDEPIFKLRAQDITAPRVIMFWIMENWNTASEAKLKEAFSRALDMRRFDPSKKKHAD